MEKVLRKAVLLIVTGVSSLMMAQNVDSISMRPSFELEYTSELQTDFKRTRMGNLLQLGADIPLSRNLSFKVATISYATTDEQPLADDLQGYSNIDADNLALAIKVAGFTWKVNDCHSLFAGIRRIDEDYFCSDGLALFTNSSCGGFPTITGNYDIAVYPTAAMGVHYVYEHKNLTVQGSLYNGIGHNRFSGKDNVFRICPKSDGVFALGQVEYRYRDSHYFLGASVHHGDLDGTSDKKLRPTAWAYAEQALSDNLTLIAAYSHAFSSDSPCRNFFGIGGKYSIGKAELGVFSDYTRVDGMGEWATELTCNYELTNILSIQPALHIIDTDNHTKCIGMMRLGVNLFKE